MPAKSTQTGIIRFSTQREVLIWQMLPQWPNMAYHTGPKPTCLKWHRYQPSQSRDLRDYCQIRCFGIWKHSPNSKYIMSSRVKVFFLVYLLKAFIKTYIHTSFYLIKVFINKWSLSLTPQFSLKHTAFHLL